MLSSDWTVSSGLHVNILTLKPGLELVASKANGVEFYFVVKGSGTFHRNDADFDVLAGYGWISDPGRYVNLRLNHFRMRLEALFCIFLMSNFVLLFLHKS